VTETPTLLPGSVDLHAVRHVPICAPADTAAHVRGSLVGVKFDCAEDIAVCDPSPEGPRLIGVITIEQLLAAADDAVASDLMDADPGVVVVGVDQEHAAWHAIHHGEASLAVVDRAGIFQGFVPAVRLLDVALRAHDSDFARLGGYLASTESARHAIEEPLHRRIWHRVPWLGLGLLGSAAAAWLVGGFEEELARDVRLAFFVPGVVYMADAVGTQTETLVIRGLSVGASFRAALRLESLTGLVVGLLIALATFPAVWLVLGSALLALAVALSLLCACGIATMVAMLLPWAMLRSGRDPAFGSGPLATVIQDLLSLIIYFFVVTAMV
jgi:magnesium transporter